MKTTVLRSSAAWALGLLLAASPVGAQTERRIVHLEISGPVHEVPPQSPLGFSSSKHFTTRTLVQRLQKISEDDAVEAVFITFENPSMGLGQIQEIRSALERVKKSKKEVYVHLDSCYSNGLYWLASAASKLAVVPTGDLWLTGLYGEQLFLKDFLANLRMEADVIHIGDYKSAGEILSRNEPSQALQEMTRWLYDDLYDQMLMQIADSRRLTKTEFERAVDNGPYTAEGAKKAGLIDEVAYRMDFVDMIKDRHGGLDFDKNYGKETTPEFDFSNPMKVLGDLFGDLMEAGQPEGQACVALIYISGTILIGDPDMGPFADPSHGASSPLRKALYEAALDDAVKAVVLRVDSPGGSAVASEIIWHASRQVSAKRKPLIVSMGNVAGSGGYYVSCGADVIFAEPGTITGSIGVVGMKMVTKGFWDWAGFHWHPVKRGANADIMATDKPFSPDDRAKITSWMEEIYGVFKSRVVEQRGSKLAKPIDEIAGGRVYTGRQAKELGLVDRMGGLEEALQFAASEARLGDDYEVRVMPRPKTLVDLIREELGWETRMLRGSVTSDLPPGLEAAWPWLERVEPLKAQAIRRLLHIVQAAQRERVLLLMPCEIVLD
jgi:protease-4